MIKSFRRRALYPGLRHTLIQRCQFLAVMARALALQTVFLIYVASVRPFYILSCYHLCMMFIWKFSVVWTRLVLFWISLFPALDPSILSLKIGNLLALVINSWMTKTQSCYFFITWASWSSSLLFGILDDVGVYPILRADVSSFSRGLGGMQRRRFSSNCAVELGTSGSTKQPSNWLYTARP